MCVVCVMVCVVCVMVCVCVCGAIAPYTHAKTIDTTSVACQSHFPIFILASTEKTMQG